MIGWRLLLGAGALIAAAAFLLVTLGSTPRMGFEVLQVLTSLAALALGSSLYAADRQSGTLDLQWLATGSARQLLRLKITCAMAAMVALILPLMALSWWHFEGGMPILVTLVFLLTNAFFVLSAAALVATFFNQSWAAGLLTLAILGVIYTTLFGSTFSFHPFLNPIDMPKRHFGGFDGGDMGGPPGGRGGRRGGGGGGGGGGSPLQSNRIFLILFAFVFLRSAASRLRRSF